MVRETGDHRGDTTRRTVLHTAIEMFAASGFEGVSTRALAARAGVNQPAIQYHFESKDGLYRAAIEWIAQDLADQLSDLDHQIKTVLAHDPVDRDAVRTLLFALLDGFADICLHREGRESWGNFLARAEIENHPALTHFSDVVALVLTEPCTALLGALLGSDRHDKAIILMGMTLFGMVTTFKSRCVNSSTWRMLGWESIGPEQVATIKSVVRQQTTAILAAAEARAS